MLTKQRREVRLHYTGRERNLALQDGDLLIATCAANNAASFFRYLLLLKRQYPEIKIQLTNELWEAAEATGFDKSLR